MCVCVCVYVFCNVYNKYNNLHRNVQKFYCRVNSVLFNFKDRVM